MINMFKYTTTTATLTVLVFGLSACLAGDESSTAGTKSTALDGSVISKAKEYTQSTLVELLKRIDHGLRRTRIDLYGFITDFPGVVFSSKVYQYNELVDLFTRRGLTRDNIITFASHVVKGNNDNVQTTESVLRSY